tara:strand:+ start:2002 stop:2715 length:714 start_codon:yes stop_codon:yes gene_type:complete
MKKAIFAWSGGKDSSLALHKILKEGEFEILGLMTTLNKNFKRISMHGIKEDLLDAQASSIGIPLIKMWVEEGTNYEYEKNMESVLLDYKQKGITHVIFGDIFLEDLKDYRNNNLAKVGLEGHYPLWKKDTSDLVNEFLNIGFKTVTCCISDRYLNENHVGETITEDWLENLPEEVDPCGENGEFHTFCYNGPIFKTPVEFSVGEKIYKPLDEKYVNLKEKPTTKGFWFCEFSSVSKS